MGYDSASYRRHLRQSRSQYRILSPRLTSFYSSPRPVENFAHIVHRSFTQPRDFARTAKIRLETALNMEKARSVSHIPAGQRGNLTRAVSTISGQYRGLGHPSKEDQPLRKYDVFQIRSWSYPIWRYMRSSVKPYVHGRHSLYYTSYSTPIVTADYRPNSGPLKSYSGLNYLAGEHSFSLATPDRSYRSSRYFHPRGTAAGDYYGHADLRHFAGFRPVKGYFHQRKPMTLHLERPF